MFSTLSLVFIALLLPSLSLCRLSFEQQHLLSTYVTSKDFGSNSKSAASHALTISNSLRLVNNAAENMTLLLSSHDHVTPLDLPNTLSLRYGLDMLENTFTTAIQQLDVLIEPFAISDSEKLVKDYVEIYEVLDRLLGEVVLHQKVFASTLQIDNLNGCVKEALLKQTMLVFDLSKVLERRVVGSFRDMVSTVGKLMVERLVHASEAYASLETAI